MSWDMFPDSLARYLLNRIPFDQAVRCAEREAIETGIRQRVYRHDRTGWTWTEVGA